MKEKIKEYLIEEIDKYGCIHLALIDPEKIKKSYLGKLVKLIEKAGSAGILIGGSTGITEKLMRKVIKEIKQNTSLPVIIFPSGLSSISDNADAIFFMSLLNSQNPYYLIEIQMQAAPLIKKYNLETISVGYIIVGEGGIVSYVSGAKPIPYKYPNLIANYALAAEMFGMKFVYIEAGSGVDNPVPEFVIKEVKKVINIPLIIGGGIKDYTIAKNLANSGANIIVTGTLLEEETELNKIFNIIKKINVSIKRK